MKFLHTIFQWVAPIAILAGGAAVYIALGKQPPPERKQSEKPVATQVRTVEVASESGGLSVELDGVVVPLREVTLAAEVPGRIIRKAPECKGGRGVKAGTLLFEIDPRDYQFEVSRLEREASQAALAIQETEAEIAQNAGTTELARQQVELAQREVKRLDGLKAGRIVTEAEYDRAIREELSAATNLTNLQGQARVLEKRKNRLEEARVLAATMLDRAKLDLSRTRITAPVDGIIVEDHVEQDSYVAKGTSLVTIEDTSKAEVRTSLQMEDLARVWRSAGIEGQSEGTDHVLPDTPATVVLTLGDRQYQWSGVLSRQEGRGLEEKTRTLPCRVIVAEPTQLRSIDRYGAASEDPPAGSPRALMRGMFVQVRVHVESPHEIVSVPEEARRPNGEVWVIRDGRLEILRPRAVQVVAGRALFESGPSGLVAGDRVITSQINKPRPGMPVAEATTGTVANEEARDDT